MEETKNYYQNREKELQAKTQRNVQRLINFVFDFVADQHDLTQRMNELNERKMEALKAKAKIEGEKKKPKV